jgi:hypothetical protein
MRPNRCFVLLAIACIAVVRLPAQGTTFQFYVSATDAQGVPVTDLRPQDVLMSENGVQQQVVTVDPAAIPMKLIVAVDNSADSENVVAHYRTGLTGLVEALPAGVDFTLISTSPQPRTVVRPTTDRARILKGLSAFSPERSSPRFSDVIVEFSKDLEKEARNKDAKPYVPVLLMISTAAQETSSYQPKEIEKAVGILAGRKARLNVILMATRRAGGVSAELLSTTLQAIVAIPAVKATNGRYEALTVPERLATLLPEWGRDLAALHTRQINQHRVTVERKASGPLQDPRIELARPGLAGTVSIDGYLP